MADRPHILHVHGSFDLGGKEARAVQLMNHWGDRLRHSIVSAAPEAMGARAAIAPHVPVDFPETPPLAGKPTPRRLADISKYLKSLTLNHAYNCDYTIASYSSYSNWVSNGTVGFTKDVTTGNPNRSASCIRRIALR